MATSSARRVGLVFLLAILAPSLVLAGLAIRSLRNQELVFERQQELLLQTQSDTMAERVRNEMAAKLWEFDVWVENLLSTRNNLTTSFDDAIRSSWGLAEVGFSVSLDGSLLSPTANLRPEARGFLKDQSSFITNAVPAEVYQTQAAPLPARQSLFAGDDKEPAGAGAGMAGGKSKDLLESNIWRTTEAAKPADDAVGRDTHIRPEGSASTKAEATTALAPARRGPPALRTEPQKEALDQSPEGGLKMAEPQRSQVSTRTDAASPYDSDSPQFAPAPQSATLSVALPAPQAPARKSKLISRNVFPVKDSHQENVALSSLVPAETEFRDIVSQGSSGCIARFLENKLQLMFWHKSPSAPDVVFGARLNIAALKEELARVVTVEGYGSSDPGSICIALLDDTGRPAARSVPNFETNWKRPFVATEVGDILPHWEVGVYLLDPAQITRSAAALRRTVGLVVLLLVCAIGAGGWLIVRDLRRQLLLARQKTDFVSNVSHELKTPLTSIRMFSELLAGGHVDDKAKQIQYSRIIETEASRLTRLINNVLNFARMERGEKRYDRTHCSLNELIEDTCGHYRPHLEANGFRVECDTGTEPLAARIDRDAIAQVLVNLISNAEKYSGDGREIRISLQRKELEAVIEVADRGPGVPRGAEEKIFEQFYRAHDSLNSGIQGAGLGLTLARQIARAHSGDITHSPRPGGGSCFCLRLPITPEDL